jgi:hypothetical protein
LDWPLHCIPITLLASTKKLFLSVDIFTHHHKIHLLKIFPK